MKNGDRPISSMVSPKYLVEMSAKKASTDQINEVVEALGGLTKREYFAAMAMQGLLAGRYSDLESEEISCKSVECADYLLSELEDKYT